jgi:hypothetical protein
VQTPDEQASVVHPLPSSHWLAWVHSVQPRIGVPPQLPPAHTSPLVQAWLSSQETVLLTCWQPVADSHESFVHTLPSSQLIGVPAHTPPEQTSLLVQAFPSLHTTALLVCVQPLPGSQASVVQTLPSLQSSAGPPTQAPPTQVSLVVQALPSLHELLLLVCVQPLAGLQLSSVHTLPSSQWGAAPPTQAPPAQVSLVVQALPSLQGLELLTW